MKVWRLLLSVLLSVLFAPALAEACVCAVPKPVCQEYWETPVVFTGLVLDEHDWESGHDYIVRFQVEEAFRGVSGSEVVLRTPQSTCTMPFDKGHRYLVFADRDPTTGNIMAGTCSATTELETAEAQDALNYIHSLREAKDGGRIFGKLQLACPLGEDCVGLPGAGVKATGVKAILEAQTDSAGRYEIPSVPPGRYRVSAGVPSPFTSRLYKVDIFHGSCAELDFNANRLGVIRGQVVNSSGKPIPGVHTELFRACSAGAGDKQADGDRTDADGEFELFALEPGRYLLAVNLSMLPDVQSPYPTTYYPGVPDRKDAIVLEAGEGQVLSDVQIRVPVRLEDVQIEVEVRWPDGRPASDAAVAVWPRDETHAWRWPIRPTNEEGRVVVTLLKGERYRIGAAAAVPSYRWACARAVSIEATSTIPTLTLVLDEVVVYWPDRGGCEEKEPAW